MSRDRNSGEEYRLLDGRRSYSPGKYALIGNENKPKQARGSLLTARLEPASLDRNGVDYDCDRVFPPRAKRLVLLTHTKGCRSFPRPHLCARTAFITADTLSASSGRFLSQVGRQILEKPFVSADLQQLLAQLLPEAQE